MWLLNCVGCVYLQCGCETWGSGCFLCSGNHLEPGGGQIPSLPHWWDQEQVLKTLDIVPAYTDVLCRHFLLSQVEFTPDSFIAFFFFFLAVMHGLWDLSSLTQGSNSSQQEKHQVLTNELPGNSQPWIWFI